MLCWTEHQPLWCFGCGLILLRCLSWSCSALHDPYWFVCQKKGEKFSNVALGNSQPFCSPCRHPFFKFFYTIQSFILFIHPLFSDFSCRLKGFRALSGIRSPKTGFGCSFIAAPLSLLLFFASPVCPLILLLCIYFSFSCSSGLLCWFLKAQMGWNESFSLWCRLGLWVEKPSEALPKAKETLSNN